jgi:uncharacterized protein YukE
MLEIFNIHIIMGCSPVRDRFYQQKNIIDRKFKDLNSEQSTAKGMSDITHPAKMLRGAQALQKCADLLKELTDDIRKLRKILEEQKKTSVETSEQLDGTIPDKEKDCKDEEDRLEKESMSLAEGAMKGLTGVLGAL